MDWRHEAACRDEDPELFFPIGNTGPALAQIEEAKKVCQRCPVKEACLAWALESGQDAGVWGGQAEREKATGREMDGEMDVDGWTNTSWAGRRAGGQAERQLQQDRYTPRYI